MKSREWLWFVPHQAGICSESATVNQRELPGWSDSEYDAVAAKPAIRRYAIEITVPAR